MKTASISNWTLLSFLMSLGVLLAIVTFSSSARASSQGQVASDSLIGKQLARNGRHHHNHNRRYYRRHGGYYWGGYYGPGIVVRQGYWTGWRRISRHCYRKCYINSWGNTVRCRKRCY